MYSFLYILKYTIYIHNIHYTIYNIQYTTYNIYVIRYTTYTIHSTLYVHSEAILSVHVVVNISRPYHTSQVKCCMWCEKATENTFLVIK